VVEIPLEELLHGPEKQPKPPAKTAKKKRG